MVTGIADTLSPFTMRKHSITPLSWLITWEIIWIFLMFLITASKFASVPLWSHRFWQGLSDWIPKLVTSCILLSGLFHHPSHFNFIFHHLFSICTMWCAAFSISALHPAVLKCSDTEGLWRSMKSALPVTPKGYQPDHLSTHSSPHSRGGCRILVGGNYRIVITY
jgi:hypothetical protein